MSVLGRIGASIGIGNLSVKVTVPSRICVEETLQGTVSITGGTIDQTARGLWVGIRLAWETTDEDRNYKTEHTVLLKQPCDFSTTVQPGQNLQVQFNLIVPSNLELAKKAYWHQVFAEVDIKSGVNVTGTAAIQVFPARPFGDLLQAVVDNLSWGLGGIDIKHAPQGYLQAIFLPPDVLAKRFTMLILGVAQFESSWDIDATVDLKEGLWRAITKKDKHRAEFQANTIEAAIKQIGGFVKQWTPES